jgi:hypothetical protein
MAPRLTAAIAVGAVTCLAVAGCGDGDPEAATGPDSPAAYLAAVEALLEPPSLLATEIAASARDEAAPAPARERLERLVRAARARLAELRALRLDDAGLRRHRDRLAAAYARMLPRMGPVVDALVAGDRAARAADPFLDSLRALPSAASSSSR